MKNVQIKFDKERFQECELHDDEVIVGLDVGVDFKGNVNNFRFILARVLWIYHSILSNFVDFQKESQFFGFL